MPGVDQRQPALRHKAKGKTESQGHWKVGTEWCLFREEQRCHDRDKEELSGPETCPIQGDICVEMQRLMNIARF